ncbi:hypothetical protein QF046_001331 [Microbacterium sp. W4I4]|uniref:hypothetical protein n=1 Tax=Microbacterium sp. W4I4 TaxID=3042295 RepID=UPI0027851D17|nr:hypothetical protein [Microbacterium sp. W4I4]MDQ0613690.1 hypothetical protein [Microbacterium sp. W4I4]
MSHPESAPTAPPQAPHQAAPAPSAPGTGLGIAGLVLAFLAAPIGLILSIVAFVKLRKNGGKTGVALAGIIIGALFVIAITIMIIVAVSMLSQVAGICSQLGPGVWEQGGVTYTCG